MKYFRKLLTYRKTAAFIAIGMLLRSTIAVGYMLDTNPADGDLFSVIICEGPAGINAIAGLESNNPHHSEHQNHSGHGNDGGEHDHAAQGHSFSACSFWSSSGQLLLTEIPFFNAQGIFPSDEVIFYQSHNLNRFSSTTHFARAPPFLS